MVDNWQITTIETIEQLKAVEDLQRIVWSDSETDVVPAHLLIAVVKNGGIMLGAYRREEAGESNALLVGCVFGFPGLYTTPDGPRLKHYSHILAVHPDFRGEGLGFKLKRAQWQLVRNQGVDRITWTYDPLLSRNAHLNIARLGAVCSTYRREAYGQMQDGLNIGLPSDRFEVDWWVNSQRVQKRLSKRARLRLDLEHFLDAEAEIINPTQVDPRGWVLPIESAADKSIEKLRDSLPPIILVEIPYDFLALKAADIDSARRWRLTTRLLFEDLFRRGYMATDFVYTTGKLPRSYYVFTHGESTL
jgi:predicted GNAT superfamily acetyltransferase